MKLFKRFGIRVQSLVTAAMICFVFAAVSAPEAAAAAIENDVWSTVYTQDFTGCATEDIFAEEGGLMTMTGTSVDLEIGSPSGDNTYTDCLKYGGTGEAAAGGILELAEPLTAPYKYRFRFSLYLDSIADPGSMPVVGLEASDPEVFGYVALGCVVNGNLRRANIGGSAGNIKDAIVAEGSWIEYETIVDMGKKKITYKVTQGDQTILDGTKSYDLTDRGDAKNPWPGELNFSGISVRTKNKDAAVFYFDNLTVEKADLLNYDFENTEYYTDSKAPTNGTADMKLEPASEGDTHGNSLGLAMNASAGSEKAPAVALPLPGGLTFTSGRYKASFSVLSNGQPTLVYAGSNAGVYFPVAFIAPDGAVRHAPIADSSSYFAMVDTSEWVDFETIIDLDNKTLSYKVSQNGETAATLNVVELTDGEGNPIEAPELGRFRFILNTSKAEPGHRIYLDDLKLEICDAAVPELSNEHVSFLSALGTTVNAEEDMVVCPALSKITLNFGCKMDESSLSEITLSETESGGAFDFKVENAKNGAYKILPTNGYLKENTKYTLTVPESVKSAGGQVIKEAYILNFGTSESYARIASAANESGETFTKADLQEGAPLNVSIEAVNATGADMGIRVIAAYYKGDVLVAEDINDTLTSAADSSVINGDSGSVGFIVPDTAADADDVRVYLWNDLEGLKPYCDPWRSAE